MVSIPQHEDAGTTCTGAYGSNTERGQQDCSAAGCEVSSSRTIVLLIRHARTDAVGAWLAGHTGDVSLNQHGRAQAARLRDRLSRIDLAAVYSSPLQRAIETAGPIAGDRGLRVEPKLALMEMNFGEWTGATFEDLASDARWTRFNAYRSMTTAPGGEHPLDVQARIVRCLEDCRVRHPNQTVAMVTHADVIRLAILHVLGAPLDFIHRLEISPASVTAVALFAETATLLYANERDPLADVS